MEVIIIIGVSITIVFAIALSWAKKKEAKKWKTGMRAGGSESHHDDGIMEDHGDSDGDDGGDG